MAMRIQLDDDEGVEVQMAPLIDCMFLLLIFFLVATTLKKMVREVGIELPYAEAAVTVAETPDTLVIGIDREGNLYLDGTPVSRTVCMDQLKDAAARKRIIRLDADQDTRYAAVLEVIEMCHIQGIDNVGLHTLDKRQLKH